LHYGDNLVDAEVDWDNVNYDRKNYWATAKRFQIKACLSWALGTWRTLIWLLLLARAMANLGNISTDQELFLHVAA